MSEKTNRGFARLPASGAHLAVRVCVLEGLHKAKDLIDITADGKVVHGDVTKDTLVVDDVKATEGKR